MVSRLRDGLFARDAEVEALLSRHPKDVENHVGVGASFDDSGINELFLPHYYSYSMAREPRSRGYPPRIFLSYRRSSHEHIEWCHNVAVGIRARGYEVYLDDEVLGGKVDTASLSRLTSLLYDCDVALMVLSPGYAAADDSMRLWIYEEYHAISLLRGLGYLEVVVLWRDGEVPYGGESDGFVQVSQTIDLVVDCRDDASSLASALMPFPPYVGPVLGHSEQRDLAKNVVHLIDNLQSRQDKTEASRIMSSISKFADTEEYDLAACVYQARFGLRFEALRHARQGLAKNPGVGTSFEFALQLWLIDFDSQALQIFCDISESPSDRRDWSHMLIAQVMSSAGQYRNAANHVNWRLRRLTSRPGEPLYNHLAKRGSKRDIAETKRLYESLLRPSFPPVEQSCEFCGAMFPRRGCVCASCGAIFSSGRQAGKCSICRRDRSLLDSTSLNMCPICRYTRLPDGRRMVLRVSVRRPTRQFSVLPDSSSADSQ